ncbi:DUF47 domain-containing protein [Lagierella massiliensis]|uniref:DUF47 domain-containing protein n=1 Tax=Lagierella massiliensis TaxID=1689303 RepID=UPI0006D7DE78|nr:DUF47 family protein [Lagierella massiliensis]
MSVYNYFDGFIKMTEKAEECADYLNMAINSYDKNSLEKQTEEIHEIEHNSDLIKHEIMANLVKEFLPPIEREDITNIIHYLDNVVDNIEDILVKMYILNLDSVTDEALEFVDLILSCVDMLSQCVAEFQNYKKSKKLKDLIVEVNSIEEKGDRLYIKVMRDLYKNGNSDYIIRWSKVYDLMEKCLDSCETVADELEVVMLKNL